VLKSVGIAMGTVLVAAGAAVYKLGKAVVEQFGHSSRTSAARKPCSANMPLRFRRPARTHIGI
jgi:hypothetical protein